ncbi:unnamed protein product [Dicrocoelium dendriticum]|nr:unnamed protein product [Dicrocoelium dendriticum]
MLFELPGVAAPEVNVDKESHRMKSIFEFFDAPVETDELLTSNNTVDELYALCDDPMREPVKLVDDQLHFTDLAGIQDLFVENTGFLVVGAVGMQGSGKSSLLNVMANYLPSETSGFDKPFAVQSIHNFLTNSPRTGGIDLYITQDRVILLDTQPLLSFAMTNYHAQSNCSATSGMDVTQLTADDHSSGYSSVGPGNWSLDVWAEISSLQLVSFLLNVCHVVLVVSDSLSTTSIRLLRLIDRAASLKPTVFLPSVLTEPMKGVNAFPGKQFESVPPLGTQRFKSKIVSIPKTAAIDVNEVEERSRQDECTDDSRGSHDKGYANYPREPKTDAELDSTGARDLLEQDGLHSEGNPVQNRASEIESSEIVDAVNRLKSMSDYSAALLHVYNQAPAAAFLDPVVCRQVNLYRNRILPSMFPGYRRLAALVTVGPHILTAHNSSRSEKLVPIKTVAAAEKAVEQSTRLGLLNSESVGEQRNPSTCPYVCGRSADENIHDGSEVLSVDPKMLQSGEDRYQQSKSMFTPEAPSTQKTVPPDTHSTDYVLPDSTLSSEKVAPTARSESAFGTKIASGVSEHFQLIWSCIFIQLDQRREFHPIRFPRFPIVRQCAFSHLYRGWQ